MKKPKNKEQQKRFFQAPKGMRDVLPGDQPYWERIESAAKELARLYDFGKIDTPVLEQAELFQKTGEDTDMVYKEMYTLRTKGGDFLALRPEFTPSKSRAYLEHSMSRMGQPQRLFSMGPVFRHDRPQLGRLRQFTQIDFDIIGGINDPIHDAQIVLIFMELLGTLRISGTVLKINSVGCRICRPIYKKQLQNFYKGYKRKLCENCVERLEKNPLRLLDCKDENCEKLKEDAPNFLDKLCATCSAHFKEVLEYLDELKLSYVLDHRLVRGLDYYSRTVFEIFAENEGSEIGAIVSGGRYDYLMEMIGGHLTPAVGAACGIERLILLMKTRDIKPPARSVRRIFVVHAGEPAKKKALFMLRTLRQADIPAAEALARNSLKAQLKVADKEGATFALILGQKEIYENSVIIRDMRTGLQDAVPAEKIIAEIKKRWRI